VLVTHVADDLLDQVLERDQARGAAVLVDHHRELQPRLTQPIEQRVPVEALRHGLHRLDQLTDPGRAALVGRHAERLLDVHDTAHVVQVALVHGEPREAGPPRQLDQVEHGRVHRQRLDLHTRGHQLVGRPLTEAQRPVEQRRRARIDRAALGTRADQRAQLLR
jgi:hypothetical protein